MSCITKVVCEIESFFSFDGSVKLTVQLYRKQNRRFSSQITFFLFPTLKYV